MKLPGIAILVMSVAASATADAGDRDTLWKSVDAAVSLGLPQTAAQRLEPVIQSALRDHAYAEAIRAIAHRIALLGEVQGGKPEERIMRLRAEVARSPREMRPVMEAILARWFWQYYQQNRWRFASRAPGAAAGDDFTTWDLPRIYAEIDAHFTAALAAAELLKRTPIAAFDALLDKGMAPDAYRPTLFDFVAHEALAFYQSGEQAGARREDAFEVDADSPVLAPAEEFGHWRIVTPDSGAPAYKALRLYQELLRFHASDRDPAARVDADLWRLSFARNVTRGATANARYQAALENLAARYADHELSARALHEWAVVLDQEGDRLGAWKLARRGLARFPESVGGRRCYNLIQQIEQPALDIRIERVWNEPLGAIDVRYRNLRRVHFRVVPYDFDAWVKSGLPEPGVNNREHLESYRAASPRAAWTATLPATDDFRERRTALQPPRGLAPGSYVLLASPDSLFREGQPLEIAPFWTSRLSIVIRDADQGGTDGFVLDAATGEPVHGARIDSWVWDRSGRRPGPHGRSDDHGRFHLSLSERFLLLARHGEERVASMEDWGGRGPENPRPPYRRALLFTDRALYRPGQTIQYKGVCLSADAEHDRYGTVSGEDVTVVLFDANHKEVERRAHRTNDYGSFSGSFTAPRAALLGRMILETVRGPSGQAIVAVEEYKRPKFRVELDPPVNARLGASVGITGRAIAYTGAPVDRAEVRWRVIRQVYWAPWRRWSGRPWGPNRGPQEIAHGRALTGNDGTFALDFVAEPDPETKENQQPTFQYSVHADVTELAGETRSEDRVFNVGYTALAVGLTAADWQVAGHPMELRVETATLDREPQAAVGTLRILRLAPPARVVRAPLAERADRFAYWRGAEPDDSTMSDPRDWPESEVVVERPVRTDTTGRATLSVALPAGMYRARLTAEDRAGKPASAELVLRVLEPAAKRCPIRVPDLLAAEHWSVEPGETFRALWGSGYDDARAYVEVIHRGRTLQSYWTPSSRTQAEIVQPVNESMRGGFELRVTMVRENRAYLHEVLVDVPWTNQRLDVRWERMVSKLEPGQKETWTAVITGPDSRRAATEMVATLYDASLDAYQRLAWPGFGEFRREYARARPRFQNAVTSLWMVESGWGVDQKGADLNYRAYPDAIAWSHGDGLYYLPAGQVGYYRGGRGGGVQVLDQIEVRAERRISTASTATKQAIAVSTGVIGGSSEATPPAPSLIAAPAPPPPDLSQVRTRANLEETAFFFPHLLADRDGVVKIQFTMPEALTEWRFLGFAHDPRLRSGFLEARAVTSRELMVQPNPPRFLREDDALEFTVKLTNRASEKRNGRVRLTLADARTGESADTALDNRTPELEFEIPALESRTFAWRLHVPDGTGFLIYQAVASTGKSSDGEEGGLPVLSRRVLVTESLPLPIRGPATRDFDFAKLAGSGASGSLRHQSLTVQMASHPAWYAVMALPYLMETTRECTDEVFERLYANALARRIAASDPKIRRVFDAWRATPALDSPLEKNQELKAVMLEEMPWVRQAEDERRARRDVGILFDENRLNDETARLIARLGVLQLADGAWPWFPGGPADDYITLSIMTGFGRMRQLGVDVPVDAAVKSLDRLDAWADATYQYILIHGRREANHLTPMIALYLYGRSFFLHDRPVGSPYRAAFDYWLGQARAHWLEAGNRQTQAHLALALQRCGDAGTARAIMRSIAEHAVHSEELGMFWRDEEASWWWYRAPIETQAMMIEAFDEIMKDSVAVEECKVWLLKQKQTQDWKTTHATADAVYALLLRGAGDLTSDARVEVALGGREVKPAQVEAGTGFYEHRYAAAEITPALGRVTVAKRDDGVAWGSVHWQYLEDVGRVTPHEGTPLKLRKALFTRRPSERGPVLEPVLGPVEVGDELVVRVEIRTDRDLEYVHLKDERGSGTEPTNVLSGYRYQDGLAYYEETRDAATNFYFGYLPKGVYVFEYPLRVQHRGSYQTGMARIQCLYAPEFGGHSESIALTAR